MKIVIDLPENIYDALYVDYAFNADVRSGKTLFQQIQKCIVNGTPLPKGHNENNDYAECDKFVCSECGIELQDWHRVERDIDDGDITYHEYTFRYCPNCGAIIEADKEGENV